MLAVAALLIFSASWNTSDTEPLAPNKSEKKLAKLPKGYKKMSKVKILSKTEVQAFSINKVRSKKINVSKVAVIEYANKGK